MTPSDLSAVSYDRDDMAAAPLVRQRGQASWISVALGYLATVPFVGGAWGAWYLDIDWAPLAIELTVLWGCALLIFLAGARHGSSFRTPSGPTIGQTATTLWLFALGILALMAPGIGFTVPVSLLLAGYLSLAIIHPFTARRGEALQVFERLRPIQTAIALVSLASILWYAEIH